MDDVYKEMYADMTPELAAKIKKEADDLYELILTNLALAAEPILKVTDDRTDNIRPT
jgi:hypothetical protein